MYSENLSTLSFLVQKLQSLQIYERNDGIFFHFKVVFLSGYIQEKIACFKLCITIYDIGIFFRYTL